MKLEITVQDEKIIRASRDGGGTKTGVVSLDPLRMETIALFQKWLALGKIIDREGLKVLGWHLYETIFNGEIASAFEGALIDSKEKGERLRVKLSFQEAALKLASLPWEFLYKPKTETGREFFLSTMTDLTLFRYIPRDIQASTKAIEESLKVLVVFAEPVNQPTQTPGSSAVTDIARVEQEMRALFGKHSIEAEFLDKPTAISLPAMIDQKKFHVMHYIGHGVIDKTNRESKIGILDDAGNLKLIPDTLFAEFIKNTGARDLRLVFLHLTECTHPDKINPEMNFASFAGMAPALIKADIPAVVAMQFPIAYPVVKKFFDVFYEQLSAGKDIDTAVQAGREKIYIDPDYFESHIFGTPVLSVYKEDRIIIPVTSKSPGGKPEDNLQLQEQISEKKPGGEAQDNIIKPVKIDLLDLRKKAIARSTELGLSPEQHGIIGIIVSKLYKEKNKGQGDYQSVLDTALEECEDPQVQDVIFIMMQELEK
jgi:hypothetical protein